jgi:hypothetical protein
LNIWNNNIKDAITHDKIAHKEWKEAGNPKCPQNPLVLCKIETRKIYLLKIRKEESKQKHEERDQIINAQTHNRKVFYQMIRKQRKNGNAIIDDLHGGNNNYDGDNILKGWHEPFQNLAQPADDPSYNNQYKQQCQTDYNNINGIYKNIPPKIKTMEELENAIKAINTGKSEDIYGLSIENIIYAGEDFQLYLLDLINNIISQYSIPELIKVGLLSPIYKNKGDKNDSKNNRGIVVLPILCKILEHIARNNFRTILTKPQSPLQRGFTKNTSPQVKCRHRHRRGI